MFQLIELLATFVESLVAISAVTQMSQPKIKGKLKNLLLVGCSCAMMLVISLLNWIEAFSYVTIATGLLMVSVLSHFMTARGFLHRMTMTVLVYLCIHAIDYVLVALFGLIFHGNQGYFYSFQVILIPGLPRLLFLLLSKGMDVALYLVFKGRLAALGRLESRYDIMIFIFGSIAYVLMSLLLRLVQEKSYLAIQTTVLVAWLLLVVCVIAVTCICVIFANYKASEQRNAYLRTTNELMVDNYKKLNDIQQAIQRQVHDFNHHLRTLQNFADSKDIGKVSNYLNSLLKAPKTRLQLCHCGNDVIDAVINCKAMDAKAYQVNFHYSVEFDPAFVIDPVDLCAILSNQIDNALEACQQLPEGTKRSIDVKIWSQNDQILFLQVYNSVGSNPFDGNESLHTTKKDPYHLHGYGIQNIRDTAAKYDGELKNSFQNGKFVSTVYLFCNRTHDDHEIKGEVGT